MLSFTNATLNNAIIHYVGNKATSTELLMSDDYIDIGKQDEPDVVNFAISPFSQLPSNRFTHVSDLALNPMLNYSQRIFDKSTNLLNQSKNIAKHLFNTSTHAGIKDGELLVALVENLYFNDEVISALAIVKSESKHKFFKTIKSKGSITAKVDAGMSLDKIDKGCLILNTSYEEGYIVLVLDKTNAREDAQYWVKAFLDIDVCNDSYHNTKSFLQVYKGFVKEQLPSEIELNKTDQIELLNRSVSYFEENESLDLKTFNQTVLKESPVIKSFNRYREHLLGKEAMTSFEISPLAVKQQAKAFKSVLKLDKNFHVYIHGDRNLVEQGFDEEKNMKYYKLFYNVES